ncbi:glycoside hydrolase family 16 protein [Arthrobacter sp. ISL-48]|uniref:glycoside hydrolase family 16 protein n=1 Tax=Arthrobacter sp. ISL-48 TaxID=2819110 RepID=UPI001BE853A3|nr:glycoside hydrolase family 16 protein [Arthrobacter sp. ISL-48]MBT2533452.1 glycoside hydrolase family 16 protein [Arthrobacter sp. ISL-48]
MRKQLIAAAGAATFLLAGCAAPQFRDLLPSQTVSVTPGAAPTSSDGTQAAQLLNWGPVTKGDEFNYTGAPDPAKWSVYDSVGHAGNGLRVPTVWNADGAVMRVSGDANGSTGGMGAKFDVGTVYNRVETRMRTGVRDQEYHPVLIVWPDGGWTSTSCPEIDYAEGGADTTLMQTFLHWPNTCAGQSTESRVLDTTQWHNYAVEWTAAGVKTYIDGVLLFADTNAAHIPTGPMHQTIQLDWFPGDSAATNPQPSWMEVDWTREYGPAS